MSTWTEPIGDRGGAAADVAAFAAPGSGPVPGTDGPAASGPVGRPSADADADADADARHDPRTVREADGRAADAQAGPPGDAPQQRPGAVRSTGAAPGAVRREDGPPGPGLLGPGDVRELAGALGVRPTKQLGQNFVIDPNTVRRIVRTSGVRADDTVVEVGPGLGSLTLALLQAARRVVAVEIDPVLAGALPSTVAARVPEHADRFDLVHADALRLAPDGLPGPAPTALVANLPYNVAVPVLLHMLEAFPSIERVLVMVQSEVADRLAAGPGSKVYGVPSVKAGWYAEVRRAGAIGRNVFWPAPNVDSGLVALTRRTEPVAAGVRREQVFAVVDAAFAQRRKTLRAALAGWAGSAAAAERALRAAGVPPQARGESLTVRQFAAIAEHGPASVRPRGADGPARAGDGAEPDDGRAAAGRDAADGSAAAGSAEGGGRGDGHASAGRPASDRSMSGRMTSGRPASGRPVSADRTDSADDRAPAGDPSHDVPAAAGAAPHDPAATAPTATAAEGGQA